MPEQNENTLRTPDPCLSESEFYQYLTSPRRTAETDRLEGHLARCRSCQSELAELLRIVDPEPAVQSQADFEPTPREMEQTLAMIEQLGRQRDTEVEGPGGGSGWTWYRWGMVAAAGIAAVALGAAGLNSWQAHTRFEDYYGRARALVEDIYVPQSPSGLRVDLPLRSSATRRDNPNPDVLETAQNLLYQALALRDNRAEARLVLGYVYLSKGQSAKAQAEFDAVLQGDNDDIRALLGRGVSQFETGISASDFPDRGLYLQAALADFEAVLQRNPDSREASYDRAWTLYELGHHGESQAEIDRYLSRDAGSLWAERLRGLKKRIEMNDQEGLKKEVDRAAEARDQASLEWVARELPFLVPEVIRSVLGRSLETTYASQVPPSETGRRVDDLTWAAHILESEYGAVTADDSYRRLIAFCQGLSPPRRKAKATLDQSLRTLAQRHLQPDANLAQIIADSESLVEGYQGLGDHWQLVSAHHLRGNCHFFGRFNLSGALNEYRRMLRHAERTQAPDLMARSLASLAVVHNERQEFDRAIPYLRRMKETADEFGLVQWAALASRYLGFTYFRLNKLDDSMREYTAALQAAQRLQHEELLVDSLGQLGQVLERLGRFEQAMRYYRQSWDQQERFVRRGSTQAASAIQVTRMNLLYRLGSLSWRLGRLDEADAHYRHCLSEAGEGLVELEARCGLGASQVAIDRGDLAAARLGLVTSLELIGKERLPELEWQAYFLQGILSEREGHAEAARKSYERSTQILAGIRETIPEVDLRRGFLTGRFDPYRRLVSLVYEGGAPPGEILDYVDRAKSMTLKESLSATAAGKWSEPYGAGRLALPPDIVIVEYFSLGDALLLFLESRDGSVARRVDVTASNLEKQVKEFVASIRQNDEAEFRRLAGLLYTLLVAPLEVELQTLREQVTLMILPDGPLHLLPFGALADTGGVFLVERFPLATAPSRSVLARCLHSGKRRGFDDGSSILLLDGTTNLPGASKDMAFLASLFSRRPQLADGGSLPFLKERVSHFEIVHFSGHGEVVNGVPSLVFSHRGGSFLDATTIAAWNLSQTRLVTLAGCATGVGPREDGEVPWGLLPAFLKAGAPSIMVSLLPLEDQTAHEITTRFYTHLVHDDLSRAQALRRAQLSLIAGTRSQKGFPPLSWAPYVLVGDPR